ncbi:unnamed protein product [Rhodiola kirilowii]
MLVQKAYFFYLDNEENLNNVVVVWNSLLNMYDKCGVLKDAARLFDEMPATLTTVLSVCDAQEDHHRVTEMVHCLVVSHGYGQGIGTPQQFDIIGCVVSMFWSKCLTRRVPGSWACHETGTSFRCLPREFPHGYQDMYCKCGNVEDSLRIFESADKIDDVSLRIFNPISPKLILHDSYFHLPNPKIIDAARQTLTPQLAVLARSVPPKMPEIHHHPKPIYLAVKGRIFDVTSGKSFYGPGGAYEMFAGKDASRALAKMSKNEDDVVADIDGLSSKEIGVLGDWERKFEAKYSILGRVV